MVLLNRAEIVGRTKNKEAVLVGIAQSYVLNCTGRTNYNKLGQKDGVGLQPVTEKFSVENLQEHMKDCSVKYYSCKICGEKFNTGGRRTAHEKKCRVMEGTTSKEALDGLFKIIRITPQPLPNYEGVLEEEANHISDILLYEIKTSLKFYISLEVRVYFEEKSQVANFQSSATILLKSSNFIEQVRNHYEVLIEKIENYTSSTSGWNVENIEVINILITHVD